MPSSLRSALSLGLLWGVAGALSFLLDLAADLWAIVHYVRSGRYLWGALVAVLLAIASVLLQLFSWIWLTADPVELHPSLLSRRCLALLHVLQLGFLYRCMKSLKQGLSMWGDQEPSESEKAYVDFLNMDISMLRLFESFIEATPQLTLVLAIVLRSGHTENYQWLGIITSFLGISWALVDYHRAMRTCLPSKLRLGGSSSAIYFLWNLLLLGPRIFVVALFAAIFPYFVVLHFFSLWLVLLFWVWLQGTNFMPNPKSEWLYRITVALILYFSWFNVSGGRTRGRAVIHLIFIISDTVLLATTWVIYRPWLPRDALLPFWLSVGGTCFLLGLLLRPIYYIWLHPRYCWEADHPDGALSLLPAKHPKVLYNTRAAQLAHIFFLSEKKQDPLPQTVELERAL